MQAPDSERRNKEAILHGVTRALQNRFMNITDEPLPGALAELAQRLDERRDAFEGQRRPTLTELLGSGLID
jgi:hypothetical protein